MATVQVQDSPDFNRKGKANTKQTDTIKTDSEDKGTISMKTTVKPVVKTNSDFEDTDLEARIEALRNRYKKAAETRSISRNKKTPSPEHSISVEKIKIEAPRRDQESQEESSSKFKETKPVEYTKGRSRGHKRTLSISFSAKSETEPKAEDSKSTKQKPKGRKPSSDKLQPSQSKPKDRSKQSKSKQFTDSYKAAVGDTDKDLFTGKDALNDSSLFKSKLAVATKRQELRTNRDSSMQKTLKSKKAAHDNVKIEKEEIREKIRQNSQMEVEVNQRKKLLVSFYYTARTRERRGSP